MNKRVRIAKVKAKAKLKLLALDNKHQPTTKVDVQDMPVNKIFTDEKRFQNRFNAYSDDSKNRIINAINTETFDWLKFDPITIWFDDKKKKYFVLSGHSRLAAFKELNKTGLIYDGYGFYNIPVRIFKGTEKKAIDLALNSNTLSTKETEVERAMYYATKRLSCSTVKGLGALADCINDVNNSIKIAEGKNANYILNLSYLNPKGYLIDTLNKLGIERDNDSTNVIRTIANWIGEARRHNPEILDIQETEIAKYLLNGGYGNKKGQFKNKIVFNERLRYSFNKWQASGGNPQTPLNLANTLSKSSFELDHEARLLKAKTEFDETLTEHQEKHKEYLFAQMSGKITKKRFDELMFPLIANVDWHKKEYERIKKQKSDVQKAGNAQRSLFGYKKYRKRNLSQYLKKTALSMHHLQRLGRKAKVKAKAKLKLLQLSKN